MIHLPSSVRWARRACHRARPKLAQILFLFVLVTAASGCDEKGPSSESTPTATSSPTTTPASASSDWCGGHGLPESKCTKCNPELIPKFKAAGDWCAEHGFPESACPKCNPQTPPAGAGQVGDWCLEHGLPESKCTKCNEALVPKYKEAGDWCEEHGFPESVCPVCNPQPPPAGAEQAAIEARIVELEDAELEEATGIQTVTATHAQTAPFVTCTARIAFDRDRIADVRALVPGIVRRVRVELGASVEQGDPLFLLESSEVGKVQAALQTAQHRVKTARANLERQRELRDSDIASERQVELAEQELAAAKAEARAAAGTLRMAGAGSGASGRYVLNAPIAGTVVRRPAVLGLHATESTSLATVADTSVMWTLCDVPEADAHRVSLGQPVEVTVEGRDEPAPVRGEITWIASEVDPRTRTVTARAEVENPDGTLRANQFATAKIETGAPKSSVSIPREAVQRVNDQEVIFVQLEPGRYAPRVVRRYGDGDRVQVKGRVEQGDAVVTTGAVLLRTEIMPGSIGAGCCEVEPPGSG